jgi:DNA-binding CsgD family transcriptional regulator
VAWLDGDYTGAHALLDRAARTLSGAGDPWKVGQALTYRGITARSRDEPDAASADLRNAVSVLAPTGDTTILGIALVALASLTASHDPCLALRLAGASAGIRQRSGGRYPPWTLAEQSAVHQAAGAMLGSDAADREWQTGFEIEPAESVRLLSPARPEPSRLPVTSRQAEVAALVADGLSNMQIANRLVLSERTVENHVQNALRKLGMKNRQQLANWAAEQLA